MIATTTAAVKANPLPPAFRARSMSFICCLSESISPVAMRDQSVVASGKIGGAQTDFANGSCRLLPQAFYRLLFCGPGLVRVLSAATSLFGAVWRGDGAFSCSQLLTLLRLCQVVVYSSPARSGHRPHHQTDSNEHCSEDEVSRVRHISIH
jgi:hypothetical protein